MAVGTETGQVLLVDMGDARGEGRVTALPALERAGDNVTCVYLAMPLMSLAVGYGSGAVRVYDLARRAVGWDRGEPGSAAAAAGPVTSFLAQQLPDDDGMCYLWECRGSVGGPARRDPHHASVSVFLVHIDGPRAVRWSSLPARGGALFERALGGNNDRCSRVVSCESLPGTGVALFVFEECHRADFARWDPRAGQAGAYQHQILVFNTATAERYGFDSDWAAGSASLANAFPSEAGGSPQLLAWRTVPSSVVHTGPRHHAALSLSLEAVALYGNGLASVSMTGRQQQLRGHIASLGHRAFMEPDLGRLYDACLGALMFGEQPREPPAGGVLEDFQREALLTLAFESGLTSCIVDLVTAVQADAAAAAAAAAAAVAGAGGDMVIRDAPVHHVLRNPRAVFDWALATFQDLTADIQRLCKTGSGGGALAGPESPRRLLVSAQALSGVLAALAGRNGTAAGRGRLLASSAEVASASLFLELFGWLARVGLAPLNDAEYPLAQLSRKCAERRTAIARASRACSFDATEDMVGAPVRPEPEDGTLFIDRMIASLGPAGKASFADYPPADLNYVLRLFQAIFEPERTADTPAPETLAELLGHSDLIKRSIVYYFLVDLSSVAAKGAAGASALADDFARSFGVPLSYQLFVRGLWNLDSWAGGAAGSAVGPVATRLLLNPASGRDLDWKDEILGTLYAQGAHTEALTFMTTAGVEVRDHRSAATAIKVLMANGLLSEAYNVQAEYRARCGDAKIHYLLWHLYAGALAVRAVPSLFALPLTGVEEELLRAFLQRSGDPAAGELLVAYLVQRCRFKEAAALHQALAGSDADLADPDRARLRGAMMDNCALFLPRLQQLQLQQGGALHIAPTSAATLAPLSARKLVRALPHIAATPSHPQQQQQQQPSTPGPFAKSIEFLRSPAAFAAPPSASAAAAAAAASAELLTPKRHAEPAEASSRKRAAGSGSGAAAPNSPFSFSPRRMSFADAVGPTITNSPLVRLPSATAGPDDSVVNDSFSTPIKFTLRLNALKLTPLHASHTVQGSSSAPGSAATLQQQQQQQQPASALKSSLKAPGSASVGKPPRTPTSATKPKKGIAFKDTDDEDGAVEVPAPAPAAVPAPAAAPAFAALVGSSAAVFATPPKDLGRRGVATRGRSKMMQPPAEAEAESHPPAAPPQELPPQQQPAMEVGQDEEVDVVMLTAEEEADRVAMMDTVGDDDDGGGEVDFELDDSVDDDSPPRKEREPEKEKEKEKEKEEKEKEKIATPVTRQTRHTGPPATPGFGEDAVTLLSPPVTRGRVQNPPAAAAGTTGTSKASARAAAASSGNNNASTSPTSSSGRRATRNVDKASKKQTGADHTQETTRIISTRSRAKVQK